ncbi:hypothetical protein SAMN06297129_1538 [Pseudooceanicola antarcticus]|uniref:N-acetylmuramoyl-L-alanine amidase n=1 Tax=Pseudooceanicola antarcticus TaxID=1247613 RepID=A0A285INZ4_9RHOB|nr:hypothetical protein [Pseudooceanicola antarcticus]SNY48681.1 hypothetical protein SAMN06297129_1538 [Pseudooceanicola antarcticus]
MTRLYKEVRARRAVSRLAPVAVLALGLPALLADAAHAQAAPEVTVAPLPEAQVEAQPGFSLLAPPQSLRPQDRPEGLARPEALARADEIPARPQDPETRMIARAVIGMLSSTDSERASEIDMALASAAALTPEPERALISFLPGGEEALASAPDGSLRPRARPEGLAPAASPVAWYDTPDQPCAAAEGFPDPDIRRNAASFAADGDLCITRQGFSEHGRDWQLTVVRNLSTRRGPVWAVLHDNENAAFDAALYAVSKYGGALVAVEAGENRSFMGQDPNRNFALTAATAATCRDISQKPTPGFTNAISGFFSQRYPVLTLHNNDDGYSGAGGAGTISARRSSASMTGLMTPNPVPGLSDEDNAILLAGAQPLDQNRSARKAVQAFHGAGVNVIYEHVRPERNDCSFSFFTTMSGLGEYYNIEAQHGALQAQKAMVDVLMSYLRIASLW